MLYHILKPIVKIALRLYFGRIVVNDPQYIDNGKPTLILANHTASFMDAILTACFIRRRIYFFTRGDVFKNALVDKILRSMGMLPVYRLSEGKDKMHLNDSSNEEALKILAKGGAVLIFCEGVSDIAKVLKPLKKGPFRLAANAACQLSKPPLLVPLGINYVTPTKPFGDTFLNAGAPVPLPDISDASDAYLAKTATDLMRKTAIALTPLVWHIGNTANISVEAPMLAELKGIEPNYSFEESKKILATIDVSGHPSVAAFMAGKEEYERWQRQYAVPAEQYLPHPSFSDWLLVILGFPFAAAGFAFNVIPVALAKRLANKKVKAPDFWAPVFLSLAIVLLISWYLLWLSWADLSLLTLVMLAALALSGWFLIRIYRPAMLKAFGMYRRIVYRKLNPSHAIVERLHRSLQQQVRDMLKD